MAVTRSERKAELDGTAARPDKQLRSKSKRAATAYQASGEQRNDADAVAGTLASDDNGNEADDEGAAAEVDNEADSDEEDGEQLPHKKNKPLAVEQLIPLVADKEPDNDDTVSSRSIHNVGRPYARCASRYWSARDKKLAKGGLITDHLRRQSWGLFDVEREGPDWSDVHDTRKDGKYERHSKWYIRDHLPWLDPGRRNQIPNPTQWQKLARKHTIHVVSGHPADYMGNISTASGKRLRSDLALEFEDDEIEEILEWYTETDYEFALSDSERWSKSDGDNYGAARLLEQFSDHGTLMEASEEDSDGSGRERPSSGESQEVLFDSKDFGQLDFQPYGAKSLRAITIAKLIEDIDEEDVTILEERGLEVIVKDIINNILERSERSILSERMDHDLFRAWRENTEKTTPWVEAKPQNVARLKEQSSVMRQGAICWFGRFVRYNAFSWQTTRGPAFEDRDNFCWFGDKQRISTGKAKLPPGFKVEGVDMAQLANFPSNLMLYRIWTIFGIFCKLTSRDWFQSAKAWRVMLAVRGASRSKLILQGSLPEGDVTCIFWGHRKDKGIAVELVKFLMDKDGCLIGQRVPGREFGAAPYTADDEDYKDMYGPAS